MVNKFLFFLLASLCLISCGRSKNTSHLEGWFDKDKVQYSSDYIVPPKGEKYNVLVIDRGFDLAHPAFKDKIVGAYTRKGHVVTEGIKTVIPQEFLDQASSSDSSEISTDLISRFHGTATAGVIANENSNVNLVFLDRKFIDGDDIECVDQSAVDNEIKLNRESLTSNEMLYDENYELEIIGIIKKHKIDVINESFGISIGYINKLFSVCHLKRKNEYIKTLMTRESKESEQIHKFRKEHNADVLVVGSAGNDGEEINSPQQNERCGQGRTASLTVGSVNISHLRSVFTNYGKCVDTFYYGENVSSPLPEMKYAYLNGTSFSAPLLVRYLTRNHRLYLDPKITRDFVLANNEFVTKTFSPGDDQEEISFVFESRARNSISDFNASFGDDSQLFFSRPLMIENNRVLF